MQSLQYGSVYIITNALLGWVEQTSSYFLPYVNKILQTEKIQIISARSKYEQYFPNDHLKWKIEAFKDLSNYFDKQIITNIICIGDSHIEMQASHHLSKLFQVFLVKTIKLKAQPRIDELVKQLQLIDQNFEQIYKEFKNLKIKLEKQLFLFFNFKINIQIYKKQKILIIFKILQIDTQQIYQQINKKYYIYKLLSSIYIFILIYQNIK
ncbi:protein kinase, putative [Ichthyophthirius multifiliis]|uniref:Protein kinase, putative n=1 Tax=Ichthyophthirius multifiliis TaxID=5932 RepID=G0QT90_ICHMU|nr:protein kinase, putative [Ichthyophthirius multifiliis]EGR31563.1 protein kinase, putative [Ichthyophthirius multifiliis]|eukprot:XP_004035049.1 protein kinase, putative [Ichthyophthirius multifiliis]